MFQEIKTRDLYYEQMELERQMKISQIQEIIFHKDQQIRDIEENNKRLKDEIKQIKQEKAGEATGFPGLNILE